MIKLKPKISIVIPVWNGKKLLEKNLPQVFKALPKGCEVIIIDDGSTDGSTEYLQKLQITNSKIQASSKFQTSNIKHQASNNKHQTSNFKVIFNKKNKGFVYTANRGVREAGGELIVLLNTDVIPQKDFLTPALKHFEDEKVFAVSLAEQDYGWAKIWWRGGFIHIGDGGKSRGSHVCAWASGGTGVFRKKMWRELGGFDSLYSPYYWEDFDLGFRAWKKGWKIIWEPKAKVLHKHEASTSKVSRSYVDLIRERNQLLFIWKNIDNFWMQFTNLFGMALRAGLGPNYLKVIGAARKQYRLFGKPKDKNTKLTAKEVIRLFKK
ncbi:glycosyltransferase family 2 protein [Candidatus Shapirobacteria bacterium]|nr:glycosyltransferase family 2 protein [Candidatus Shapirobacteria bacterium]